MLRATGRWIIYFFPLEISLNGAGPPVEGAGNLVLLHSLSEAFLHSKALPNRLGWSAQGRTAPRRRQRTKTPEQTPSRVTETHVPEPSRVETFSLSYNIL